MMGMRKWVIWCVIVGLLAWGLAGCQSPQQSDVVDETDAAQMQESTLPPTSSPAETDDANETETNRTDDTQATGSPQTPKPSATPASSPAPTSSIAPPAETTPAPSPTPEKSPEVTLSILTDTGSILPPTPVQIQPGESVFDLLKRVTQERKIQMEFSGSAKYAYIQGIDNLYEFDKGPQSGWIYSVNGVYQTTSCSVCVLQGGETVVWQYTIEKQNI